MILHLATLVTQPLELRAPATETEHGVFEVEVRIDNDLMIKSGSPSSYFFKELAIHLAQAMKDTDVPREYWIAEFELNAQLMFNLPAQARMV